jgi:type I restriction enzyme, S subunit
MRQSYRRCKALDMPSSFRRAQIAELVQQGVLFVEDGNHGEYRPLADEFTTGGTPFIRPDDLSGGRVDFGRSDRINETAVRRVRKGKGKPGDIVFTHRATVGRIARVRGDDPPFVANPGVTVYRSLRPEVLDQGYLYYFMHTPAFMNQVWAEAGNTDTFPYVSLTQQRSLFLEFPSIEQQRCAAQILATFDDKIQLDERMSDTLEEMAQALFKSWFVDFDPVRAKMEGRDSGLREEIANLFPGRLVASELGEIPEGWEVGPLEKALVLQRGFDLPATERTPGAYPVLAASGPSGTHNEFMVRGPGVTTGRSGVLGKVFYVAEDFWPLNTSLWVKEFRHSRPAYAFHLLRGLDFAAFNAGSAVPTLNRNHVHTLPTLLPPIALVDSFERFAKGCLARQAGNEGQSITLGRLRDTLLPPLISGELRVGDAERFVAEAT